MIMYQLPIPTHDNSGKGLARQRAKFLAGVASIAGGYTLHGNARGVWLDRGRRYRDQMTPLSFAGSRAQADQIVREFHHDFPDQAATMLTALGPVELIRFHRLKVA